MNIETLVTYNVIFHLIIAEFQQYFESVTSLAFEEAPNYNFLKGLFKQLFISNQFTYDSVLYDWEVIAYQQQTQQQQRRK